MTFFSALRARSAKAGLVNRPQKLATAGTDAPSPLRNNRRWSRCSSGVQQPGGGAIVFIDSVIREELRAGDHRPEQLAGRCALVGLAIHEGDCMGQLFCIRVTYQSAPEHGANAIFGWH